MKRLILFILLLWGVAAVWAAPVTSYEALQAAKNFIRHYEPEVYKGMTFAEPQHVGGMEEIYVVQMVPQGYVLVAADDVAIPILAYSLDNVFDISDIPPHVYGWLNQYAAEIRHCRKMGEQQNDLVRKEWSKLQSDRMEKPTKAGVGPLVTTTWAQDPYYNIKCPYDRSNGGYSVTGCVATAMAQIMKFWNHPEQGNGSHSYRLSGFGTISADFGATTYDWQNMPNALSQYSSTTQKNAVATLMFHCGVSVEMEYSAGASGSGAQIYMPYRGYPAVNWALIDYFDYNGSTIIGRYKSDYSDSQWKQYLKNDLDNGRPILYGGGDNESGHAFVCDGYNSNGKFHFNWGWGGYYDGFYYIGSLTLGGGGMGSTSSYSFNQYNHAIFGIQPNSTVEQSQYTVSATVNNSAMGSVSGTGTFDRGRQTTLYATANDGYRFDHWNVDSLNPFTVSVNRNLNYTATFATLGDDTLHYDNGTPLLRLRASDEADTLFWAIRLRPEDIAGFTSLTDVMTPAFESGSYVVKIYQGGTTSPQTLVSVQHSTLEASNAWGIITLDNPVTLNTSQPLWIVVGHKGGSPAAVATYAGTVQGSWFAEGNGEWGNLTDNEFVYTWMLRGVFKSDQTGQCRISTLPYTQNFETGMKCWQRGHQVASYNDYYFGRCVGSDYAYAGDYAFVFSSYYYSSNYNLYLISPEIAINGDVQVSFYYNAPMAAQEEEEFRILYSTTDDDVESFNRTLRTINVSTAGWHQISFTLPSNAKYMAINYTSNHKKFLYIDNIEFSVPQDGGGDETDCVVAAPWRETFTTQSATINCWNTYDMDRDGYSWRIFPSYGNAASASYVNYVGALTPDNWLVSPGISIPAAGTYQLSWQASGVGEDFAENYSVYISNNPNDFETLLFSETIPDTNVQTHAISLANYAGQTVYIAFRHHACTGLYYLVLANVAVTEVGGGGTEVECNVTLPWVETFEATSTTVNCWMAYDNDNDGYTWGINTDAPASVGYGDGGVAVSESYRNNVGALTPDNWLISPEVSLPAGASYSLSWATASYEQSSFAEHYSVYVSLASDPFNFYELYSETINVGLTYRLRTVDLSSYAGQTIHVAFRHHDCNNQYMLLLDHVSIAAVSSPAPLAVEDVKAEAVSVYPNPTTGIINVAARQLERVEVYDLMGRLVITSHTPSFSVAHLPNGAYTLHIVTQNETIVKRIMKK